MYKEPKDHCFILVCCQAPSVAFPPQELLLQFVSKIVFISGGYLDGVKSGGMELSCWLQAILFHAREGGKGVGRSIREFTSSSALSLHPPRARWGLVECARSELSSWPFCIFQCVLQHTPNLFYTFVFAYFLIFGTQVTWKESSKVVNFLDNHRFPIALQTVWVKE